VRCEVQIVLLAVVVDCVVVEGGEARRLVQHVVARGDERRPRPPVDLGKEADV
jgi:hypothetical protein